MIYIVLAKGRVKLLLSLSEGLRTPRQDLGGSLRGNVNLLFVPGSLFTFLVRVFRPNIFIFLFAFLLKGLFKIYFPMLLF